MNHLLCIMKDLESGITLMKDMNGGEWTKKDVRRMMRKHLIEGYDIEYGNNWVTFNMDEVQYVYIVPIDFNVNQKPTPSDGESGDIPNEFFKNKTDERNPEWKNGNGAMFR